MPRRARARPAHPPEDPVDRRLVDVDAPGGRRSPARTTSVDAPVVLHRRRVAALLADQVLGQEPLDRLVHRHVPVGLRTRRGRLVQPRSRTPPARVRRLRRRAGVHRSMHPPHLPFGVPPCGHRQLPHSRPHLDLRAAATRSPTASWAGPVRSTSATDQVVDPDTALARPDTPDSSTLGQARASAPRRTRCAVTTLPSTLSMPVPSAFFAPVQQWCSPRAVDLRLEAV